MTETIQTAMDRLMTISVEPQDYVAEDGLLYCGSCKTPKEAFFPNGKKLFGRDRHPAECRCRQATREKQEKEERARLHYEKVQRLKLQGFTDWAMQHWTFGKISKEKFLELKQDAENEIEAFRQTKAENEKELVVVQEELQQKKQIAGNTEVLLTADNLQQYVKKIEVDHKKNTYTEFAF